MSNIIHNQQQRRQNRVRLRLSENLGIPRLSVLRSNVHIWVQVIDDKHGKTLAATSSKALKLTTGTKIEQAKIVGQTIGEKLLKLNIKNIRFDRGSYRYHGRVKALADGARAAGLNF